MRIQFKFFLAFSLISSIPLLILLFGVVGKMENELVSRTENELHATLNKMANELEIILTNQKSVATGLSRIPVIKKFSQVSAENYGEILKSYQKQSEELEQFFLNYQHAVSSIQALRFIDKSGKTLVKVKEGKPIRPDLVDPRNNRLFIADQVNRAFFRNAINSTEAVTMSNFELGQVSPDADFCPAMVRYSVPIRDEIDQLEGVLVINMWGTRLDSTIQAALGGYPGEAYLVEVSDNQYRDGIYLYHEDNKKRFGNQLEHKFKFSNEILESEWSRMRSEESRGSLFRNDGSMFFYHIMKPYPDRNTKWLIMIKTTNDVVLAPVKDIRNSIMWLLSTLLVISLFVAIWAAFHFARPVQRLANLLTQYADGDQDIRYNESRKDEIGKAGNAFNYLVASLEQAEKERDKAERAVNQSERLASLGQLAAGISHEINNPLMNINSLAGLVESAIKDKDEQAYSDIQLLQKEVQRCAQIVQGILNFSRKSEPSFKEFDFSELIIETLTLLQHRIDSSDLHLVTQIHSPLIMRGDPNLLQQVLVNILLNAIQASPPDSNIILTASGVGSAVEIEILDSGKGIQSQNVSKVFDPFFTTKREGEGTGLGLSVSYGIVKRHGGTITIENAAPKGVRVSISLPVTGPEIEDGEKQQGTIIENEKSHEGIKYVG